MQAVAHAEQGWPPMTSWRVQDGAALPDLLLIPTLEYLQRGGRIGRASARWAACSKSSRSWPFRGQVTPYEKVRTYNRALVAWRSW